MWNRGRDRSVLITSASQAPMDELRGRQRRYVLSMLFRTVCLILAVVAFRGWARLIAIAIALITPWIAVVIANAGPKRRQETPVGYTPPSQAAPAELESSPHDVVDSETWVHGEGWERARARPDGAAPGNAGPAGSHAAGGQRGDGRTGGT